MGVNVVVSGGNINVGTGQAGSAAVSNSDDSYQATVAAGGSLELPDITITKNDDTTVTYPSVKDLDLGVIDPCVPSAPSGWDAMVAAYGQGYVYPISGQTTSYRTGDDADIESTIFAPARAASKEKVFNTLATFTTLQNNNAFGNTNRFTDDAGGQTYANDLVIDHYTGLMWYRVIVFDADWIDQIDLGLSSTQGGYSDWFLMSASQYHSIYDHSVSGLNYLPFSSTIPVGRTFWTSTTYHANTAQYWQMYTGNSNTYNRANKTPGSSYRIICRKYY